MDSNFVSFDQSPPDYKGILNIDNQPVSYSIWAGPAWMEYHLIYSLEKYVSVNIYAGGLPLIERTGDIDDMHVNRCVEHLNNKYGLELPEVCREYVED